MERKQIWALQTYTSMTADTPSNKNEDLEKRKWTMQQGNAQQEIPLAWTVNVPILTRERTKGEVL